LIEKCSNIVVWKCNNLVWSKNVLILFVRKLFSYSFFEKFSNVVWSKIVSSKIIGSKIVFPIMLEIGIFKYTDTCEWLQTSNGTSM